MTPEEIWAKAEEQSVGLRVVCDDPIGWQEALLAYRFDHPSPGLFSFTIQVRKEEVWIIRSKPAVQIDGEYKPLEE